MAAKSVPSTDGDGSTAPAADTTAADPSLAAAEASAAAAAATIPEEKKWPGWPGDNVFRVIVPVLKVGGIIDRKGDISKRLCEETRARVRVLDGPICSNDRIMSRLRIQLRMKEL